MTRVIGVQNSNSACVTCGAWQELEEHGECRLNPPTMSGWPQTKAADWCLKWLKDTRHKIPVPVPAKSWQIGINYVFVRDYPESAATWLAAALSNADAIPIVLRPVLSDVFGGVLTCALPDWVDKGDCCEGVLCWAEKLPGFCNVDSDTADTEYIGLLMSMADKAEIYASEQALQEIPANHPWHGMTQSLSGMNGLAGANA